MVRGQSHGEISAVEKLKEISFGPTAFLVLSWHKGPDPSRPSKTPQGVFRVSTAREVNHECWTPTDGPYSVLFPEHDHEFTPIRLKVRQKFD